MNKEIIFTNNAPEPVGPYSQAVRYGNLLFISGQIPFGYKNISGTLQKDPMEQLVLQQMKNMRENGASLAEIARHLTEMGIPTKNGGRWQANTINVILGR